MKSPRCWSYRVGKGRMERVISDIGKWLFRRSKIDMKNLQKMSRNRRTKLCSTHFNRAAEELHIFVNIFNQLVVKLC